MGVLPMSEVLKAVPLLLKHGAAAAGVLCSLILQALHPRIQFLAAHGQTVEIGELLFKPVGTLQGSLHADSTAYSGKAKAHLDQQGRDTT